MRRVIYARKSKAAGSRSESDLPVEMDTVDLIVAGDGATDAGGGEVAVVMQIGLWIRDPFHL